MIDLIGTGQLNGYPIKPMCSVLVNEWAFYGPYTTLPFALCVTSQRCCEGNYSIVVRLDTRVFSNPAMLYYAFFVDYNNNSVG